MRAKALLGKVLSGWAMQDSNLRPSDYESADPSNKINDLGRFHREAPRQTATENDSNGHRNATHLVTRDFPHLVDRVSFGTLYQAMGWVGR